MYLWLVALHLVGVVLFALTHGVSMFVVFRIPHERNRDVIAALLGLSSRANQLMYIGLLLLAIGGFGAAWLNAWLLQPWIIASYVVLIGTMIAMYAAGAGFYYPLRDELVGTEKVARLDDEALFAKLAASKRPHVLATVGLGALVILVWLMVLKPGLA